MPDLTEKDGPLSKPGDVLFEHSRNGFQSPGSALAMPPRGGNPSLEDQALIDVICYMQKHFGASRTIPTRCRR